MPDIKRVRRLKPFANVIWRACCLIFSWITLIEAHKAQAVDALNELTQGQKHTHWMWFIFPIIQGLGKSDTAQSRVSMRQRHLLISSISEIIIRTVSRLFLGIKTKQPRLFSIVKLMIGNFVSLSRCLKNYH
jgi:hypothetical protein